MRGIARSFGCALALLTAHVAPASSQCNPPVPSPANSTVPSAIDLVVEQNGGADPSGEFTVIVRDPCNNPINNCLVEIRFANCVDVWPSSSQPYAGLSVACGPRIVSAFTDAVGTAKLSIVGSVIHRASASGPGCAEIWATPGGGNPVMIGQPSVAAFDQDGMNGMTANDLGDWLCDFSTGSPFARSDYDHSGSIGANDLSFFLTRRGALGQGTQTGLRCDLVPVSNSPQLGSANIDLTANACAQGGGATTLTLPCAGNTGQTILVLSVTAPSNLASVSGFEAEVEIKGSVGAPLANWWRFDGAGCRRTSLNISALVNPSSPCPQLLGDAPVAGAWVEYPYQNQQHSELVTVWGANGPSGPVALTSGVVYAACELRINNLKTVGLGNCAGCNAAISAQVKSFRFVQGDCGTPARPHGLTSIASTPPADFISDDMLSHTFIANEPPLAVPAGGSPSIRLGLPHPNPARGATFLRVDLNHEAEISLAIHDVNGRLVRRLLQRASWSAGEHGIAWDGTDDSGARVASGVYFAFLDTGGQRLSQSLIHLH